MYTLTTKSHKSFETVQKRIVEELKKEGFGVLTEIDVQQTLKEKLNVETSRYKILGACNPSFAHKALLADSDIGTLLPCNVIIREEGDEVIVAAMKPTVMENITKNSKIAQIAYAVELKWERVINSI